MIQVSFEFPSDYRSMRDRQLQLRQLITEGKHPQIIICTTHNPVYTLGKHGHQENVLHLPAGVECIRIERGGDVTWHGPGQLTVYPLVNLHTLKLGVRDYVNILEQAVIDTLASYGIHGERVEGATGVWIGKGTPQERKICAIGVSVSRGVTMHGLALNVNNSLVPYSAINPCGFIDKGVTTIACEVPDGVSAPEVEEVARLLTSHLVRQLETKISD